MDILHESQNSLAQPLVDLLRDHRTVQLDRDVLLERSIDLELDNRALRETLQAAIDGLARVTHERDQLRKQLRRLRDEYRARRVQTFRQAAA